VSADNGHDRAEGTEKFVMLTTSNKFDAGRLDELVNG
jgi:hypothetical protein